MSICFEFTIILNLEHCFRGLVVVEKVRKEEKSYPWNGFEPAVSTLEKEDQEVTFLKKNLYLSLA